MRRKRFDGNSKSIKYVNMNNDSKIKERAPSPVEKISDKNIYDNAVDKYSKHIFMLINGRLAD